MKLLLVLISGVFRWELANYFSFLSLGEIISLCSASLRNTFRSSNTGHDNLSIILLWLLFLSELVVALTRTIATWFACRRRLRARNDLASRLICLNAYSKHFYSSFFFRISTQCCLSWLLRRWILKLCCSCIDWKCFRRRYLALLRWGRIIRIQLVRLLADWKNLVWFIVKATIWASCRRSDWNLRCFLWVYGVIPFIAVNLWSCCCSPKCAWTISHVLFWFEKRKLDCFMNSNYSHLKNKA